MNPEQIKQLQSLSKVFNTEKIVSKADIKAVVTGIAQVLKSFKLETENLNKDSKQALENALQSMSTDHQYLISEVSKKTDKTEKDVLAKLQNTVKDLEKLARDVVASKPKDGEPGKNADEDVIVDSVLAKIKLPEQKDVILDDAGQIATKLETLKDDARLDFSAIKNVPEVNTKANGGGWRNLSQLHDVTLDEPANNEVLKYNSTSKQWENGTGGGGSSPLTTKGDVYGYSTADARIPVGANGEVLTADSTVALGLKWAAVAGTGDVTATSNLGDNLLIRGDGAGKGVQNSGISIDDSDNVTGMANLTATGALLSGLTASQIVITDASKNLASAPVATYPSLAELIHVKGVTSAIQTQLNAKGAGTVTSVTSANADATVATTTTTPVITIVSAPKLTTARTIAGVSFDGSANITIAGTNLSDTALIARLASPTFTGTPTLPTGTIGTTQTAGNSTTALATTAFATTALNLKANIASPTFTGTVVLPSGQALIAPALGTPASGVMTNVTGLPVAGLANGTDGELIT